jgi:hypothetical protein
MSDTRSKQQEKRIAKELAGQVVAGSGAFDFQPHDVITDQFLLEAKYTGAKSYSLNAKYLHQFSQEAKKDGKLMALVLDFVDPPRGSYAVITYADFKAFNEMLEEENEKEI